MRRLHSMLIRDNSLSGFCMGCNSDVSCSSGKLGTGLVILRLEYWQVVFGEARKILLKLLAVPLPVYELCCG